jgi:photosystem II stability/assembly factor-like uncharacterized protein
VNWERIPVSSSDDDARLLHVTYVSAITSQDVWAVGFALHRTGMLVGQILHWDGNEWQTFGDFPVSFGFWYMFIEMVSPDDGWFYTESRDGKFLMRWDGSDWRQVSLPTTDTLTGIRMLSSNEGWATGSNGTILKWDGISWKIVSSPTTQYINAIAVIAPDDIWVSASTTAYRWDGAEWKIYPLPAEIYMHSLSFFDTTNGLAVADEGVVLHWDGDEWICLNNYDRIDYKDISMVSSTFGWAIGYSSSLSQDVFNRWNGSTWTQVLPPSSVYRLNDIEFLSESDGWAIGKSFSGSVILHWDGNAWDFFPNPMPGKFLVSLSFLTPDDGWIIAQDELNNEPYGNEGWVILHWDGSNWALKAEVEVPDNYIFASEIKMFSSQDGWIVGAQAKPHEFCLIGPDGPAAYPAALHWDGQQWQSKFLIEDRYYCGRVFTAIDGSDPTQIWFSSPLYRWNGSDWHDYSKNVYVRSLSVNAINDIWGAGAGGILAYWDGYTWKSIFTPTDKGLNAIDMVSPNEGWAVGNLAILHFKGSPPAFQGLFLPSIAR